MTAGRCNPARWLRAVAAIALVLAACLQAATLPRGDERLRELAVPPKMSAEFSFGFTPATRIQDLTEDLTLEQKIRRVRHELDENPDQAHAQLELGRLWDEMSDTNAAMTCYAKAVTLGRRALELHPDDVAGLITLAEALRAQGIRAEAESLLRRATAVASEDWKAWVAWGQFCMDECLSNLIPAASEPRASSGIEGVFWRVKEHRPTPEELESSVRLANEAARSFEQAVGPDQNHANYHLRRAVYLCQSNLAQILIRHYRNERPITLELLSAGFLPPPTAIPDLHRASELSPKAYKLLSWIGWMEWYQVAIAHRDESLSEQAIFRLMPEKSRQVMVDAMARLKVLAEGSDSEVASGALLALCTLRQMSGDAESCVSDLKRAVELNPDNEGAWEMLVGLSAHYSSPDDLVDVCERRLQRQRNSRNHLFLAKALYLRKDWERSYRHARLARREDPDSLPAALMVTANVIRTDPDLQHVKLALLDVARLLRRQPPGEDLDQRRREFILNYSIGLGLEEESLRARALLDKLLSIDPEDKNARDILNALP